MLTVSLLHPHPHLTPTLNSPQTRASYLTFVTCPDLTDRSTDPDDERLNWSDSSILGLRIGVFERKALCQNDGKTLLLSGRDFEPNLAGVI